MLESHHKHDILKIEEKKEFLQKSTTFRPQKVHCLVHNVQKYKLNGTIRLENMTPKILEKRGKCCQKNKDFHDINRILQVRMMVWKFMKIYEKSFKMTSKFSNIFLQKQDFYEIKLPNRMTQKYLIMMKFMDFRKGVPL